MAGFSQRKAPICASTAFEKKKINCTSQVLIQLSIVSQIHAGEIMTFWGRNLILGNSLQFRVRRCFYLLSLMQAEPLQLGCSPSLVRGDPLDACHLPSLVAEQRGGAQLPVSMEQRRSLMFSQNFCLPMGLTLACLLGGKSHSIMNGIEFTP